MAIPVEKTLYLGLGGFGKMTIHLLRRKFYEQYQIEPERVPNLEFLVLDTDPDPLPTQYIHNRDGLDVRLSLRRYPDDEERGILTTVAINEEALDSHVSGRFPAHVSQALDWLDPEMGRFNKQNFLDGAGGMRSIGKMSLILGLLYGEANASKSIINKLRKLHRQPKTGSDWTDDFIRGRFSAGDRDGISVFVFASTVGGTGGGMFLDIGYFIRSLFKEDNIDPAGQAKLDRMMFFGFLPSILHEDKVIGKKINPAQYQKEFDLDPKLLQTSGCYASLSELEQGMVTRSEDFSFTGGFESEEHYIPDWAPDKAPLLKGEKPYDWVYLLGSTSVGQKKLQGVADATDMVADLTFALLVEQSQVRLLRSLASNHATFSQPIQYAPTNQNKAAKQIRLTPRHYGRYYGSFGLSRIYIGESRLRRWASFAIAEKFTEMMLTSHENFSDAQAGDLSTRYLFEWGWNSLPLFNNLAHPILKYLDDKIRSLTSFDGFKSMVSDMVRNPIVDRKAAALLDQAKSNLVDQIKSTGQRQELESMTEEVVLKHGIEAATALLGRMTEDLEYAHDIARQALQDMNSFKDVPTEVQDWWFAQQDSMLWLSKNTPSPSNGNARPFDRARSIVKDLSELRETERNATLPKLVTGPVEEHYIRQFGEYFIDLGICRSWYEEMVSTLNLGQASGLLNQLESGLFKALKALLSNFEKVVEQALAEIESLRVELVHKPSENRRGTSLKEYMALLLEREGRVSGTKDGFRPEKLSEETPKAQGRNNFVGGVFQSLDRLVSPTPDTTRMVELFKKAASSISNDEVKRIWEIRNKPVDRLQEELLMYLSDPDEPMTQFSQEPSLKTYLNEQGASKQSKLAEHLQHAFDHHHPFILHDLANDVSVNRPSSNQYILAPTELLPDIRNVLGNIDGAAGSVVEGYDGSEIMMVDILDGLPLPSIVELHRYAIEEAKFKYPGMIWTRKQRPPYRLMSTGSRHDIRKFVVAGILLGVIEYHDFDPTLSGYRFHLERSHLRGVPDAVTIGDTIQNVVEFFEKNQETNGDYHNPFIRLQTAVQRRFDREEVQRQFGHLLTFLSTHYVNLNNGSDDRYIWDFLEEEWNHRLEQRFNHTVELIENFNRENDVLKDWMHVYCRAVPINKPINPQSPDQNVLPALLPKRPDEKTTATQLQCLYWYNSTFGRHGRNLADVEREPFKYAMTADKDRVLFSELDGINPEEPADIPDSIIQLAWPVSKVDEYTNPSRVKHRRTQVPAFEEPDNF